MGSWPFLIYVIDVLTTDGNYGGWVALMLISALAYAACYFGQKIYEDLEKNGTALGYQFFEGENLSLNQDWSGYKAGDTIEIVTVWNSDNTLRVRLPDGKLSSNYIKQSTIYKVTRKESQSTTPVVVMDVTKGPRKIAVFGMVICFIGILYANFMPQKETAYKMLAAYVGQNVVESPRTQQLADSTIKYLDAQIKKYTDELDATTKKEKAEKSKAEDKQ